MKKELIDESKESLDKILTETLGETLVEIELQLDDVNSELKKKENRDMFLLLKKSKVLMEGNISKIKALLKKVEKF